MQHWDRKTYRTRLAKQAGMTILVVASIAILASKSRSNDLGQAPRLKTLATLHIEASELSGLSAVKKSADGSYLVSIVGDGSPQVIEVSLDEQLKLQSSNVVDFTKAVDERFALCHAEIGPGCKDALKMIRAQWEAFAIDGRGRNFLLQESSHAIIVMNSSMSDVQNVVNFDFSKSKFAPSRDSKKQKKVDDDLSAEGFVLLRNGHILIAKEKNPAVLGEFGPAGSKALGINKDTILGDNEVFEIQGNAERSSLVLLAEWRIAGHGKCDVADLTADKSGVVYVLSENCRSIQKIDRLVPDGEVAVPVNQWRLPKSVRNPEGFSIDELNRFWVVSDLKERGNNLFIVAPQ